MRFFSTIRASWQQLTIAAQVPSNSRGLQGSRVVVLWTVMAMTLGTACKKPSQPEAATPTVLAKVGEVTITVADFEAELERRRSQGRLITTKDELLDQMIAHLTLVQRAKRAGLHEDPEVVRTYHNVLIGRLREKELAAALDGLDVDDSEIAAAYEGELARYTRPDKVRLALLFLSAPPKASDPKLAELKARLNQARALVVENPPESRGFGKLAIRYSEDQTTRYKGGDIGWVDVGRTDYRWPAEVLRAGQALGNPGDLSDVIRTSAGFYLAMKLDSRDGAVTPLEKAAPTIRQRLLAEKRDALELNFREESHALAGVEKYAEALAAVEAEPDHNHRNASQDSAPPSLPQ